MGLRLVAFPSIKIILSRDFYFCPVGIFPFGMSCPAASPDGDKGAVAKPLWEEEKAGSDYAGDTRAQLLGCRHARLGCPVLRGCPCCHWTLGHPWMARLATQQLDTWALRQHACFTNPSWQDGIFGGTVFLLAPLSYSVFQLLSEKEKKK